MMPQSDPPEPEVSKEAEDVSASLAEAGASLPNPEEIRTDIVPRKTASGRWKWYCAILTLFVVFIVVVSLSATAAASSKNYSVEDCLTEHGVSDPDLMSTEGTPQYEAVQWMIHTDRTKVPHPSSSDHEKYRFISRYVMALIYFSLGGPTWFVQLNWLSKKDFCAWQERDRIDNPGIYCLPDGSPYYLNLRGNNLIGSIPSEIGHLTSLFKLDLQRNYELGGNIPTELCRLEELVVLELNDNSHTGTIPECMGKMTALNTLFLSNNALRGSLPARLAGAKSLAMLKLDDNMLTGSPLSVLNSLTNLFHLFVSGNQFTGNINGDFLKKHEKLLLLDMSHNEFTSNEFPSQLLELTSLALVDISQNRLGGQFPPEINLNNNLGTFSAYNNSFVGTFPSTISNLRNLAFLDLSQNQLGGKMPDTLGEFTRLSTLFLSDNPFSAGTIPESIVNMTALQEVSLRNTNRNGEVPSFSELNSKLYLLDLSSNQLTGLVPETLGSVPMLAFLLLNDNPGISGGLPSSFGYSKFLQNAFFDGTNLEGDFSFLCTINANTNITFVREFYADCKPSSSTSAKVACSCCECCTSGVPGGCSEPAATNLDLQWEESFARRNKPDFDI